MEGFCEFMYRRRDANNINGPARLTVIKKREKTCANSTARCTARIRVGYLNRRNMNTASSASPVNLAVPTRADKKAILSDERAHARRAYFIARRRARTRADREEAPARMRASE
jgi:hypothetical protein